MYQEPELNVEEKSNGMWNNPFMYLVWMWMMRWMNRGEWGDGDNCQKLQSAEIQG